MRKISSKKSAEKHVKKSPKKAHLLSLNQDSNSLFREMISPRSPPYINSKIRIRELELERNIKSYINTKRHPELLHLNYKNWRIRSNENNISYLDSLFAKQLARYYDESNTSANDSKKNLQSLSRTLEKALSPKIQAEPLSTEKSNKRLSLNKKVKLAEELSSRIFNNSRFKNDEVNDASAKLDLLRSKIRKNN